MAPKFISDLPETDETELLPVSVAMKRGIGSKLDAAATDTTNQSVIAMLKGIFTKLGAVVLTAGDLVLGRVKLTDGTNTAAIDAANTARTAATKTIVVEAIDAAGKIVPGADAANTARTTGTLAMPVQVVDQTGKVAKAGDTAANSGFVQAAGGAGSNGCTNTSIIAAASINATVIKASAGRLHILKIFNDCATKRYVKLYNKATTPAPATDTGVLVATIPVQPNSFVSFLESEIGEYFPAGISLAIVANQAIADATAVVAGDVIVNASYA